MRWHFLCAPGRPPLDTFMVSGSGQLPKYHMFTVPCKELRQIFERQLGLAIKHNTMSELQRPVAYATWASSFAIGLCNRRFMEIPHGCFNKSSTLSGCKSAHLKGGVVIQTVRGIDHSSLQRVWCLRKRKRRGGWRGDLKFRKPSSLSDHPFDSVDNLGMWNNNQHSKLFALSVWGMCAIAHGAWNVFDVRWAFFRRYLAADGLAIKLRHFQEGDYSTWWVLLWYLCLCGQYWLRGRYLPVSM